MLYLLICIIVIVPSIKFNVSDVGLKIKENR